MKNWPSRYTGMPVSLSAATVKSAVCSINGGNRNSPNGTANNRKNSGKASARTTWLPSMVQTSSGIMRTKTVLLHDSGSRQLPQQPAKPHQREQRQHEKIGTRIERRRALAPAPDQPGADRDDHITMRKRFRALPDRHHGLRGVAIPGKQPEDRAQNQHEPAARVASLWDAVPAGQGRAPAHTAGSSFIVNSGSPGGLEHKDGERRRCMKLSLNPGS